jgi:hypothetical protein
VPFNDDHTLMMTKHLMLQGISRMSGMMRTKQLLLQEIMLA